MKSGRILLVLFLSIFTFSVFAQQQKSVEITGVVVEEGNNIPIEQATIRLLSVKDSTFIGGVASSQNGNFTLKNVRPGDYLLNISFIGFEPLYQPLQITGRTNPVNLGKLELSDGSILLGEAVVVGKAAEMIVRNDTIEYNADSFKVTEGSALEELLKKMPGVEIDSDGKITVNGKEVKKMLVDGEEFFSDDPKVASKNLPANMIDKVQVLDRLSEMSRMTGFDDGEEETVINLTVKPGMKQGWFGNAQGGYGNKDRYEGNAMINRFVENDQVTLMGGLNNTNNMGFSDFNANTFSGMGGGRGGFGGAGRNGITSSGNVGLNFSKKFNPLTTLGGNGRYSHSDNETISNSETANILDDGTRTYDYDNTYRNNISDNFGTNFRMEWKPDSMTTVIFRPNFSYSKTRQTEYGDSYGLGNDRDTISLGTFDYHAKGESYNINGQLEYSKKLNNDGRIFSASISGGYSDTNSDAMSKSTTEYASEKSDIHRDQRIDNDNTGFNYRGYLSWVEPIGNNNFVQLTYSINQRKQEQLKNAYNLDEEGLYTVIDTAQTQNLRNNYINQRASLSFKSIRAKFNYTIGFNVDPSYISNERFIGDSVLYKLTQNVVNFSPSAQFRFNFSRQKNLRIDYNGRTNQPSISQMQPTPDYTNPTNTKIGNPDLKPRYTNNMHIRYQSFKPEQQMAFMVMGNFNYTVNDIVNYTIYDSENKASRTTTYENISGNYNGNVRVMMNTPLRNKKFTVSSMSMASFSNRNEYSGTGSLEEGEEAPTKSKVGSKQATLMERGSFDFRSSILDIGVTGNITYNNTSYKRSAESQGQEQDKNTYNYGVGGRTTIYLPANIKLESDINWSKNSGYAAGYSQNEVLWNAAASISFLKGNQGTLQFKIYDLLKQRSSISQTITASKEAYTEYNTINSYFMASFIYRFSAFKGGATTNDAFGGNNRRGPGGMGGPPHGRF